MLCANHFPWQWEPQGTCVLSTFPLLMSMLHSLSCWVSRAEDKFKDKIKNFQIEGIPWWSGGQDFVLSLLRAWVQSLVSEVRFHVFNGQVYLGKTVSLITFLEMFSIYQNIKAFVKLCNKAIHIKQSKAVNSQINQAICCCLVTKTCPTLCDSMDSSLHGISQARILE